MDREHFVFRDPLGNRWRNVSRTAIVAAAALGLAAAIFVYSLLVDPRLEPLPPSPEQSANLAEDPTPPAMTRPKPPAPWVTQTAVRPPAVKARPQTAQTAAVRLGFLDDDQDRAILSLRDHADQLTHVAPAWFWLTGMPPHLTETPDPDVAAVAAEHHLGLMPMLANLVGEDFDPEAVEHYLRATPRQQETFASELRQRLQSIGARGVVIVWEQIDPVYRDEMVALIGRLHNELQSAGLELWLSVPVGDDLKVFDLDALAPSVDRFVAMLYYETGEQDEAGPLASQPWFDEWLDALVQHGDPSQWVISLGTFSYDWPADGKPEVVSFYDIMARAASARVGRIENQAPYDGAHFSYDLKGVDHDVWFLDAISFHNQQRRVEQRHLGGLGIDRLGTEDPLIWTSIRCASSCKPGDFERIPVTAAIGMVGQGDFVEALEEHRSGLRHVQTDKDGGWGVGYIDFPRTAVVRRHGDTRPDRVALTFDDGPDPDWTPRVLDVLKERGVKAAFFVTGAHANQYPELVQRIVDEGHEIGNHTFSHADLSRVGEVRATLELNATQRAIEEITGRSTLLFRPPYDADRTPHQLRELEPLLVAQQLGYTPAMSSIDPLDWERPPAELILERIREARPAGNVILLHDAGGDRGQTLAALPRVIDYLQARGDAIVSLHELLGVSKLDVMPTIPPEDPAPQRVLAGTGLSLLQLLENGAWSCLMVATGLMLLRTLLVVGIALYRARREHLDAETTPDFTPPVSVVLAAHNEEKVIAQTLGALLASRYPNALEVLVVDDGSTDDTARVVSDLARADARLRLIGQVNQGKAAALRNGLGQARHDYIVTLDADTQFTPDTIAELVRPLQDPSVGAVSCQIHVGNSNHLLGRFQNLEYISAFNLDRRTFDVLDAITVVPGAASAYRADAIRAAGGIQSDTLAEDTDLTLSLHRVGYRIHHTTRASAVTEAPQTLRALFRQRKRWSFGTLQCLWKHRALFCNPRFGWLGWFAIPGIWFFQVFLVALAPAVDLWLVMTILQGNSGPALVYALLFMGIDLALALVACRLEGEPWRTALWVFPMRIIYRPLLSLAVLASLHRAIRGSWMAWGLQERWGFIRHRGGVAHP